MNHLFCYYCTNLHRGIEDEYKKDSHINRKVPQIEEKDLKDRNKSK